MEPAIADTRTVLLQAALACFAERGFDGTSLRMIADLAGRPLSLLPHYFKNKELLYVEVFRYVTGRLHPRTLTEPLPESGYAPRDKNDAVRMLREQVHFLIGDVYPDLGQDCPMRENIIRLWMHEVRDPRQSLHPLISHEVRPLAETIRNCLRFLRPDLGEAEVTFLCATILGGTGGHGFMAGLNKLVLGLPYSPNSPFQAAEFLVDFYLRGLGIDPSGASPAAG